MIAERAQLSSAGSVAIDDLGVRLSSPVRVRGTVAHGEHRGRTLGFPTANLYLHDESQLPSDGVYAGFVRDVDLGMSVLGPSAISIGTNPTFGAHERRLEAHILGLDADIYGHTIDVEIAYLIRGMARFTDVDQLIATIQNDVDRAAGFALRCTPFAEV